MQAKVPSFFPFFHLYKYVFTREQDKDEETVQLVVQNPGRVCYLLGEV